MNPPRSTLADAQEFDPSAFIASADCPKKICDLMLALSVIYNDIKDLLFAMRQLKALKPPGEYTRSKECGEYHGIDSHILRRLLSVIHEALNILKDNRKSFEHDYMKLVIDRMDERAAGILQRLCSVASGQTRKNDIFSKTIADVRDKASFHYDLKFIAMAYHEAFYGKNNVKGQKAVISLGSSMEKTRFFYGDAAAQQVMRMGRDGVAQEAIMKKVRDVVEEMNWSVMHLIQAYLNQRGVTYTQLRGAMATGKL